MTTYPTHVSRACDLLLNTSLDDSATLEHIAAGQLLARTLRGLFVLRNIDKDDLPTSLVPPIDQYGDAPVLDYTVLFLSRDDAEAAKKYEEVQWEHHIRIEPLSDMPELEDR